MSIPEIDFSQAIDADAQLQQELSSMFAVDTQSYLQRYSQIAENLQVSAWRADIQELYRCVHTIKGGAVTVGAEAALQVASALEDVLSDLRYLEPAPQFADTHLSRLLLECGELLTVALDFQGLQDIAPLLSRIQKLHQEIREHYLPQWDQVKHFQQEFAEQGFDLIVLELEIALEQLPNHGQVSDPTLKIAQNTLEQLQQIGQELQFDATWTNLLHQAQELFVHPVNAIWRSQWLRLFQVLKAYAKQGNEPIAFEFESFDGFELEAVHLEAIPLDAPHLEAVPLDSAHLEAAQPDHPQSDYPPLDHPLLDPQLEQQIHAEAFFDALSEAEEKSVPGIADWLDTLAPLEELSFFDLAAPIDLAAPVDLAMPVDLAVPSDLTTPDATNPPFLSPIKPHSTQPASETPERVQIPVALEKLDQSAQSLVETLLSLQTAQGYYQTLQTQITQLVGLAQEGAQYITHLRQIQDDYALLDQMRDPTQVQGPTPERYRQGYSIINRLLETSLRLSEIGAETGKTSQQVAESFQQIDRNAAKLRTTIEESRLVSFQNLSFRAKAILRELTTRYGKPAQLLVEGEHIELDVSIARALEPALLHLIRNAYDHGLESAADRMAQGKPAQGTLTLSLRRRGNSFQLQIRDDGHGIDATTVQARAQALGLPLTQTQTAADLLAVICQPGFSSQTQVSEISGRGIGMDVVAAQVTRLKGQLEIQTALGTGTTFQLKFPVPRLLVPCVLLQSGNQVFAIPNDDIKTISLFSSLQPSQNADQTRWQVKGETESTLILDTLQYWQPQSQNRAIANTAVCLYISTAAQATTAPPQGLWLLADELLEQSELIINPLPTPLVAPNGLIGVSLQKNSCLIPVLEALPLVEHLLSPPTALSNSANLESITSRDTAPTLLIVDDAALMRRRLESSLNAYGYITHACVDGQEAWNWLQTHPHPNLIITDIEMPNMDGFTLIDRCRSQGIPVPILVVSSRLSEEWSDETSRLGATDYLTKGFSTIELIKKVDSLLN
ncbi:MAG TPA: response regulator [Coleofasciculaceae cyanobacterium]|jgi:chemotaxis protein histidine kinase CheA